MSGKEQIDACLRVVSNRCRNLRKAIEKGKTWEQAQKDGQELNPEQTKSVKLLSRKEALLVELQEILKKQTVLADALLEADQDSSSSLSKRAAKAARGKQKEATLPEQEAHDLESNDVRDNGTEKHACDSETEIKSSGTDPTLSVLEGNCNQANESELEELRCRMTELEKESSEKLILDKKDTIGRILNLFHVVDFLRQSGSREALLSYFDSLEGKRSPRMLTGLDMDLLCYFNVMLTTPNGNVPHHEAVRVSSSHCSEFLRNSTTDAFKGTSYATLNEIVDTIATCPILTERGTAEDELDGTAKAVGESKTTNYSTPNGGDPSHKVTNVTPGKPLA